MSVRLATRPVSVGAAYRELAKTGLGGVAIFVGRVRPDRRGGEVVTALDYEVDRAVALARLAAIARTARGRFGARAIVVWHRAGRVNVDEIAVIVGAACGHRAAAFAAARYLIEQVKASVPIWKEDRARPARRPRRRPSPSGGR